MLPAVSPSSTRSPGVAVLGGGSASRYHFGTDLLIRAALWLGFTVLVYQHGYLPARNGHTFLDWGHLVENTARAANDGHPFMAYTLDPSPRLIRLEEYGGGYTDPGLAMLVAMTSVVGRVLVGEGFVVGLDTVYADLLAFYLLTACVFVLPGVPLMISLGGLAALGLGICAGGPPGSSAFTMSRWAATYAAVVVGMLAVTATLPKRNARAVTFVVALSILVSYAQFIRHEAAVTASAVACALVASALVLAGIARLVIRDRSLWARTILPISVRALFTAGVLVIAILSGPLVVRGLCSLAWGIPYSETRVALHGAGHSLYMSLGYVANPYNISWRDNVGVVHARLIDPTVRIDGAYMEVLRGEAIRIALESPWLVRDNLVGKLTDLRNRLVLPITSRLLWLVPIMLGLGLVMGFLRGNLSMVIATVVSAALVAATLASPLVIHPDYVLGLEGGVLVAVVLLPFALVTLATWQDRLQGMLPPRIATACVVWSAMVAAVALLVSVAGGFGWYRARASEYNTQLASARQGDPLAEIEAQGYKFDHVFNDLPNEAQERLIERLEWSPDARVARATTDPSGGGTFFRPRVAVLHRSQIHLISTLR